MNIITNAKEWLFSIALKKGIIRAAAYLAAYFAAHNIAFSFTINGAPVGSTETGLTTLFMIAIEIIRNYLKQKGVKFL